MCDYSLHATASRPAKAGETLISTAFPGTFTRGFAAVADRNVAVCLMPGTELGFAEDVKYYRKWLWPANSGFSVARFCKVAASIYEPHQDALEFPSGKIVLLTALIRGQRARVLQLPPKAKVGAGWQPFQTSAAPAKGAVAGSADQPSLGSVKSHALGRRSDDA
jgi:hypothetical protein